MGSKMSKDVRFMVFGASVPELPAQVQEFETAVIPHPNHTLALKAIGKAHSRWSPPSSRGRLKAQAVLIVGESGAGKSTALEAYEAMFPALKLEDVVDGKVNGIALSESQLERLRHGDVVRVVLVEAPKNSWRERPFVAAMFQALGYKAVAEWNTNKIIDQLRFYADELGVEIFLIDEGHHLVKGDVIDFLKSLLNRIGIPLVIAGLPELLEIQLNEKDMQIARRSKMTLVLEPYNWKTIPGRTRTIAFIKALEANLKMSKESLLYKQQNAARLYVASGGEPGWMAKFMSEGLEIALERESPKLDLEILGEVYANIFTTLATQSGELGFGELLDEATLDQGREVQRAGNPFLCPFAQLESIWEDRDLIAQRRRAFDARPDASARRGQMSGSRKTRIRGTGRPPLRALAKN